MRPTPSEPDKGRGGIPVHAVVLAAGQSRRMGGVNKLLAHLEARPLVRHVVEAAQSSRVTGITVVSGHEAEAVIRALDGLEVDYCYNPEFAGGMSSSLRCGIEAVPPECEGVIILLGDMPRITGAMINRMLEEFERAPRGAIILASDCGRRGNPVLWPAVYFDALKQVSGDVGGRHLIDQNVEKVIEVELGDAARLDIDTPEILGDFKLR